jgi:hypothetical protein
MRFTFCLLSPATLLCWAAPFAYRNQNRRQALSGRYLEGVEGILN